MTGGLDLSFGFPEDSVPPSGNLEPASHMRPVRNKGKAEKP